MSITINSSADRMEVTEKDSLFPIAHKYAFEIGLSLDNLLFHYSADLASATPPHLELDGQGTTGSVHRLALAAADLRVVPHRRTEDSASPFVGADDPAPDLCPLGTVADDTKKTQIVQIEVYKAIDDALKKGKATTRGRSQQIPRETPSPSPWSQT